MTTKNDLFRRTKNCPIVAFELVIMIVLLFSTVLPVSAGAQQDQGTITGVIQDSQGRAVAHADVSLKDENTGLISSTTANDSGIYVFTPIKIGRYTVSATAPTFATTRQEGIELQIAERLAITLTLHPGSTAETVEVTTSAPVLQTEDASRGAVITARELEATLILDRNYVFMAQLVAGVQQVVGSRGQDDFSANGMRPEQNSFILDGVDNNVNIVDYINGASFVVAPPPEALSEFKVQTSNYSAEMGHSAGASINATIKSGTNVFHGGAWEYLRNDMFDARNYFSTTTPELRQNEFGGDIGGPIIRNRLFFFGDYQGQRVVSTSTGIYTVPTAKMRTGDFSELLSSTLTGGSPKTLYSPGTAGSVLQQCNGQQNVFCTSQLNPISQKLFNALPLPNYGVTGQTYSNFNVNSHNTSSTDQFDSRADWNISPRDQTFARFSFTNTNSQNPPPFGSPLSGGGYTNGIHPNRGKNFVFSETHIFSKDLINELRFGYNWLSSAFYQQGYDDPSIAASFGLGGIPSSEKNNGGLPKFAVTGLTAFGAPTYNPIAETENVYEVLDNVTKVIGNHTTKAGFTFQNIRNKIVEPVQSRGTYTYSGKYTNKPSASGTTGFGGADFITDYQATAAVSNITTVADWRWYRSAYIQDDWKASRKLTLNLGLRYEYFQPYNEQNGRQANFVPNGAFTGATYYIPTAGSSVKISPTYQGILAKDNVQVAYTNNPGLINAPKANLAPRFGLAYSVNNRLVFRAAYGLFYGGIENVGFSSNMGSNLPFSYNITLPSGGCVVGACATDGVTLARGFTDVFAAGIDNYPGTPGISGAVLSPKITYVEQYNAAIEYELTSTLDFTTSYVGSVTKHAAVLFNMNQPSHLVAPGANVQAARPFPDFIAGNVVSDAAGGNYNSLQMQLNKRLSGGLHFSTSYTYSHALGDDYDTFGGAETGVGYRNPYQLGLHYDYGTSMIDVRHRGTANVQYELPFGRGREFLNGSNWLTNGILGGWTSAFTFRIQTGEPVEIGPSNNPTNGVGNAMAYKIGDPFSTALSGTNCATQVKNIKTWFNPCAFQNPVAAQGPNDIASYGPQGRTEVPAPGYTELDSSFSKAFSFHEHSLQFRADVFNLPNHPSFGEPTHTIGSGFGQITSTRNGPRVIQLALKWNF